MCTSSCARIRASGVTLAVVMTLDASSRHALPVAVVNFMNGPDKYGSDTVPQLPTKYSALVVAARGLCGMGALDLYHEVHLDTVPTC